MTIPCQTAETKTKANRICVIVWNLIVNFNICWEMKSLCCWIVDAGQVLCSMHADVSELGVINYYDCAISKNSYYTFLFRLNRWDRWWQNLSPLNSNAATSQQSQEFVSVCIDVVQVNCRFISQRVHLVLYCESLSVNSQQDLRFCHKFLPIIEAATSQQDGSSVIKLVGIQ